MSDNRRRALTRAYWILAALLAVLYLYAGGIKVVQSQQELQPMMGWVDVIPMPVVRAIGVLEVLGAAGLVLPPLTGILPRLAVAAATGLVLIQAGGVVTHVSRGEAGQIGLNIALLAAAVAAAWLAVARSRGPERAAAGLTRPAGGSGRG